MPVGSDVTPRRAAAKRANPCTTRWRRVIIETKLATHDRKEPAKKPRREAAIVSRDEARKKRSTIRTVVNQISSTSRWCCRCFVGPKPHSHSRSRQLLLVRQKHRPFTHRTFSFLLAPVENKKYPISGKQSPRWRNDQIGKSGLPRGTFSATPRHQERYFVFSNARQNETERLDAFYSLCSVHKKKLLISTQHTTVAASTHPESGRVGMRHFGSAADA